MLGIISAFLYEMMCLMTDFVDYSKASFKPVSSEKVRYLS